MERTIRKPDSARFAVGEKCYGVLVNECHVLQIEHQLLPGCLDVEQLLEVLDILRLHPAAQSEHHWTVCGSLDSEHKSIQGQSDVHEFSAGGASECSPGRQAGESTGKRDQPRRGVRFSAHVSYAPTGLKCLFVSKPPALRLGLWALRA